MRTLVVDLAIAVDVCLADHLVHLLVGELLAKVGHDVPELHAEGWLSQTDTHQITQPVSVSRRARREPQHEQDLADEQEACTLARLPAGMQQARSPLNAVFVRVPAGSRHDATPPLPAGVQTRGCGARAVSHHAGARAAKVVCT